MISLTTGQFPQELTRDLFCDKIAGLSQLKALSNLLGLSASLQSATSETTHFLNRWAALEEKHAEQLSCFVNASRREAMVTQQTPLHLSRTLLRQNKETSPGLLFFESLIGVKQWEVEQAQLLLQQSKEPLEKNLVSLLTDIKEEDEAMIGELIALCKRCSGPTKDRSFWLS